MKKHKKISRKKFFRKIIASLSIPVLLLMYKGVERENETSKHKKLFIPTELTEGITFYDRVIIQKYGSKITVFSSSCSHLGCKINKELKGEIICPCHGSSFDLDGNPLNGPATEPLRKLKLIKDDRTGKLVVYV